MSVTNSLVLQANLPATGFSCPTGHGTSGNNGSCRSYSVPLLDNNVIWQNRSFYVGVTKPSGTGTTGQQSTVALFNSLRYDASCKPGKHRRLPRYGKLLGHRRAR